MGCEEGLRRVRERSDEDLPICHASLDARGREAGGVRAGRHYTGDWPRRLAAAVAAAADAVVAATASPAAMATAAASGGGGCRPPPPAAARSRRHRVASNGGGGSSGHGRRRWAWRRRPWQRCAAGGRDEETEAVTAARETAAASAGAVEVSPVTSPLLLSRAPRRHAAARHPTAFSVAEYRRPFGIFAGAGGQAGGRLGGGAVVHRDSSRGGWTPTWGGGDIARTLAWCRRRCRCCWRCAPGGERRVRYRAPVGRPAARRGGAAAAAVRVGGRGAGAR